jgi:hypothetical protein
MVRHCIQIALILSLALSVTEPKVCSAQKQSVSSTTRNRPATSRIPKTWDADALRSSELPLADSDYSPVHVPASFYYQVPERPIYKSYPVYAPGREPHGYWERLNRIPPEVVWGRDEKGVEHRPPLRTQEDRMRAGDSCSMLPSHIPMVLASSPRWPTCATRSTMKRYIHRSAPRACGHSVLI